MQKKEKRLFYEELSWAVGIIIVTLGVRLVAHSSFGVSMVVAPAYILAQKLGISFGLGEYLFQGLLLLALIVIYRGVRLGWSFTVVTVLAYGAVLDLWQSLLDLPPPPGLPGRILCLILGACLTAFGIALMFRTYLAPQVYELFVKSVAVKLKMPPEKFKRIYDISSLCLSAVLALLLFRSIRYDGQWLIGPGTVVCTCVNSLLITQYGKLLDRLFRFRPAFPGLARYLR